MDTNSMDSNCDDNNDKEGNHDQTDGMDGQNSSTSSDTDHDHTCHTPPAPFDLEEIFQIILGYVSPTTIPNCRLVSHHWNTHTVDLMKKRDWTRRIIGFDGSGGLLEYTRHIIDSITQPEAQELKLNLSISLGADYTDESSNISTALFAIDTLVVFLGHKCVTSFTFAPDPDWVMTAAEDWAKLLELFHQIAPGLKRLSIKETRSLAGGPQSSLASPTSALPPFPELQDLLFQPAQGSAAILTQLVNRSPKLQKLAITVETVDLFNVPDSHQLMSREILVAFTGFTSTFQTLLELSVSLADQESYTALKQVHFPMLQKLKLIIMKKPTAESTALLAQFLQQNCPQLKSLELSLMEYLVDPPAPVDGCAPIETRTPEFPARLPQLPQLTHFGFCVLESTRRPSFIKMDDLVDQFENLKSVTMNFGTFLFARSVMPEGAEGAAAAPDPYLDICGILFSDPNRKHREYDLLIIREIMEWYINPKFLNHTVFVNATQLKLIVDTDSFTEGEQGNYGNDERTTTRNFCKQVRLLFPNLEDLHVENQLVVFAHLEPLIKDALHALLEVLGPGIETLEITNYYRDWLAQIFTEFPEVASNLQHLESIILPPLERTYLEASALIPQLVQEDEQNHPETIQSLSVQTLLQHIPELEYLKVHDIFLRGHGQGQNKVVDNIDDILQEFEQNFPSLTIELI